MDPVELLGSKPRLRVLCALLGGESVSLYRVCRRSGVSRRSAAAHLRLLTRIGVVKQVAYDSVRLYQLNREYELISELEQVLSWICSGRQVDQLIARSGKRGGLGAAC